MLRESQRLWPTDTRARRLMVRAGTVRLRLEGAVLIERLYRSSLFDFVRLPSKRELYMYQLCLPRRLMPANALSEESGDVGTRTDSSASLRQVEEPDPCD
jgi:hypothetical protein